MPFVTVGAENGSPIALHYEDYGIGRPGEPQVPALLDFLGR